MKENCNSELPLQNNHPQFEGSGHCKTPDILNLDKDEGNTRPVGSTGAAWPGPLLWNGGLGIEKLVMPFEYIYGPNMFLSNEKLERRGQQIRKYNM